jgi:hypothetical protein
MLLSKINMIPIISGDGQQLVDDGNLTRMKLPHTGVHAQQVVLAQNPNLQQLLLKNLTSTFF